MTTIDNDPDGSLVVLRIMNLDDGTYCAVLELNGEVLAASEPFATIEEVREAKRRFAAKVDAMYPGTRLQKGGAS